MSFSVEQTTRSISSQSNVNENSISTDGNEEQKNAAMQNFETMAKLLEKHHMYLGTEENLSERNVEDLTTQLDSKKAIRCLLGVGIVILITFTISVAID